MSCVLKRACTALFAALLATPLASALDAGFTAAHSDASFPALWLAELGLLAPFAPAIAVAAFVLSQLVSSKAPLDPHAVVRALSRPQVAGGRIVSTALLLVVWLLALSALGLRQLLTDATPTASAAGFGLGLLLLGVWVAAVSVLVVRAAQRWTWLERLPLGVALAGSILFVLVAATVAISFGDTSGQGHAWQMFGVLAREELDLRAPAVLVVWVAVSLTVVLLVLSKLWLVVALVVLGVGASLGSALSFLDEPTTALGIEQQAPLGKRVLPVLRKLSDSDSDGSSDRFGGGDCNDADPSISPAASDVPNNGIDEDCTGSDAEPLPVLETEPDTTQEASALEIPENLNVVLVSVDTLRFDMGYMGYTRPITPNIDRLAKRSVVYERFYALASYTGKSIGPMLIGKYPSETHRGWSHFNVYPKQDVFIQERLQQAGVRTTSVQGHWYFDERTGLGRGFDVLDLSASPRVPQAEGDRTVNSDEISDVAIKLLSDPANTQGRFFAWVHYLDPHAAYVPHEKYDFGSGERALYDGEIAYTDEHVGRLLDFIAESPFADRTAILFTSDHGEAFGEHGFVRHGRELWEELVRVPFIMYLPGVEPRRFQVRRGAIDLVATIAELYGLSVPDDQLSGRSLLDDVRTKLGEQPPARPILIDMPAGPHNADRQATIYEQHKIITVNGRPLGLFNLERDPDEKDNLMKDKQLLDRYLSAHKAFRQKLQLVHVRPQ